MITKQVSKQAGITGHRFLFNGDGTPADWSSENPAWGFPSDSGAIPAWMRKMVLDGHEVEMVCGTVYRAPDRRGGASARIGYQRGWENPEDQATYTIDDVVADLRERLHQFGMTEGEHYTHVRLFVGPTIPDVDSMKARYIKDHVAT